MWMENVIKVETCLVRCLWFAMKVRSVDMEVPGCARSKFNEPPAKETG